MNKGVKEWRAGEEETSEKAPAGSLITTPVMVEAATMRPISSGAAPRSWAKRGSTGLRAI
jgi:hypothetical protein